jgi:5-methylcytosine-specific restriction endonuclease McrA
MVMSGQRLQPFPLPNQGDYRQISITIGGVKMKYCKKCQVETERYTRGHCKPCNKACSARWRAVNLNRYKAVKAEWRKANPERVAVHSAAWDKANPERKKANAAAWKAANPERVKELRAAWHKKNPDSLKIIEHNRRARKRANGGTLSKGISERLFKLQKGKCPCCSQPLGDDYHMDHIIPLALGGANIDSNIQLLRQRCNNQKRAKDPIEFMQSRGFLL